MSAQMRDQSLFQRFVVLFHSDLYATKILLSEIAVIMSAGFAYTWFAGNQLSDNMSLMGRLLPIVMWSVMFAAYAGCRAYTAVNDTVRASSQYAVCAIGAWLWGCMLISSNLHAMELERSDATSYLYIIPLQMEIWIAVQTALWWTKYPKEAGEIFSATQPKQFDEEYER